MAAARQFKAREGHLRVPRAHIETVTDTDGHTHDIRLGVFRSNTRSRHKQRKLTPNQAHEVHQIGLLA
ncbi:helicase associated domain-containing protein [Streptomyces albus]|uniref:helicase associated domain-containing protein n=1 Tax=Streptomyces albus TaxID=1888 RepID=UPI0039EF5B79